MIFTRIVHTLVMSLLLLCSSFAQAGQLASMQVQEEGARTKISIALKGVRAPKVFGLSTGAPRIVIDVPGSDMSPALQNIIKTKKAFDGGGDVQRIRYALRNDRDLRLVADLGEGASYQSHVFKNGVLTIWVQGAAKNRLFTGVPYPRLKRAVAGKDSDGIKDSVKTANLVPVPSLRHNRRQLAAELQQPVIVIDPGHGGRDPGAIGRAKVREETVNLLAALELRRQLLKTGKYKVVLTRQDDTYISLEKRVLIARKAGADLFISLHADSFPNPKIRGASVYTLADRAQKRGQRLVNTQNWILDVDLSTQSAPVSDILVDLAQRKTLSKSGEFADILVPELAKTTKLLGNTHREAGLYVLLAPDVPAILLEMGFLSNSVDEKLLNTAAHRKKLMKGVTRATNMYFESQTTLHATR